MNAPSASIKSSKGGVKFELQRPNFPKSFRLLSAADFQQVFAQAERFANRHWTFIVRPNNLDFPRLGLAISKKQAAKAVVRNRLKRLARETFRVHKLEMAGYDVVVLARKGADAASSAELVGSFKHLINKLKKHRLSHKEEV